MQENKKIELEKLNVLLNKPPKRVKTEKRAGKKIRYVPIFDIENNLRMLFLQYKIEVVHWQVIANSIAVQVRVHYLNPVTNEWVYHDGLGAKSIQLNAGANPTDFTQIKPDAIEKCLPAAKSQAIKNAVKHLGRLFGAGLNTDDTPEYQEVYQKGIQSYWLTDVKAIEQQNETTETTETKTDKI